MNTRRKNEFSLLVSRYFSWLLKVVKPKGFASRDFKQILDTLLKIERSRGKAGLISFAKAARTNILNYLSGNPERLPGVRLTASGIPKFLGPVLIKEVMNHNPIVLRLVLTLLFSTRALKTEANPDIKPIIDPLDRGASIDGISLWMGDFWRTLGYTHQGVIPRYLKFKKFHFSTKSGPNGHALASWATDLFLLPDKLISSLRTLGGEGISSFFDTALVNKDLISTWCRIKSGIIRKITYFADKEGKTRVIAIGDYFSQTVLKRLHDFLYKALRKIPQDCTFNQGSFKERMKNCEVYYSCDLTAATDRFPIKLITLFLSAQLPTSYAKAWEDIMVGYPFSFTNKDKTVSQLNYSVGNPMGFYSSWASFALIHHYIVYYCCRLLGKDWKTLNYCLLGDDIVIGDKDVGELYLTVMANLGVKISKAKSHTSPHLYEFAKRLIHKGSEITPFPFSALKLAGRSDTALATLLLQEEVKGWSFQDGISVAVSDYLGMVKSLPSRVKSKGEDNAFLTEQIIRIIWGQITAGQGMTTLARRFSTLKVDIKDEVGTNILANIMVDFFSQSNEALLKPGGKPLGLLAEQIVMILTGSDNPDALTLLKNPHLDCYGSIEQTYLDLLKKARQVDTIHQGEWPIFLRAITIPLSDELFQQRTTEVMRIAVSKVGKALIERFKVLESYPSLLDY